MLFQKLSTARLQTMLSRYQKTNERIERSNWTDLYTYHGINGHIIGMLQGELQRRSYKNHETE